MVVNSEGSDCLRRVGLVYDDRMCKHATADGDHQPENPDRIRAIWKKLESSGIPQRRVVLNAKEAEDKHVPSVHSKNHLNLIKKFSSKQFDSRRSRIGSKFNSIYMNEGSSEAACLAAGSVIEGKVCDICGGSGFGDFIVTCIKCRASSEHIYCLPLTMKNVPSEWTCEDCLRGDNVASLTSREIIHQNTIQSAGSLQVSDNSRTGSWFKRQKTVETAKVKFLTTEEAVMLTSGASRMVSSSKCNMDSRFGPGKQRNSTNRTTVGFTSDPPGFPSMKLKENHGIQPSGCSRPPRHGYTQSNLTIKQRSPHISKELDGKKAFPAPAKEHACRQESTDVCTHARGVETSNRGAEKEINKASTLVPSMHVSGKKTFPAPAKGHACRQEPRDVCTHARGVETSNTGAEKEINKASTLVPSMHVSGGKYHSDVEPMNSDKGLVPPSIPPKLENIPLKCAAIEAVWKGSFKFVDNVTLNESYVGFHAHPPYIVHRKAYEFSKQMPAVLEFERLPRCSLWEQLFQDDSPDGDDIALYFFPGRFGKSRQDYVQLLKLLEAQDLAMRSHMDGVELLLFTSKQMRRDFQRIGMQYYLWGVFHCRKTKEAVIQGRMNIALEHPGDGHSTHSNKDNDEVVDMEIDMIGGVDVSVGKIKKEQSENCASFPGFTVKVENRFASTEPLGSGRAYPGFEEAFRIKFSGNSSKPTFKENPGFNDVKATVKKGYKY